jgi:acetyl-CoA carboxylase carboxyl transferase subunit alpha
MNLDYLDFEQPIAELQEKIQELRRVGQTQDINLADEIERLEHKCQHMTRRIFNNLSPHQIVLMARHPLRPHAKEWIHGVFDDFVELHGDRHSDQAVSMMGGLASLDGTSVMVLGHEKGRSTQEKIHYNFGMASPEGFRKALRLMKTAERFHLPVITFIDTPGAYPGITAEESNQSEAIARNLFEMAKLKTPIICVITGEGCSGGALGIGVGDRTIMLQYSYFSVISPEGCASILWKDAAHAKEAAAALNLTAQRLHELGLIDSIIPEPLGGAHRDTQAMMQTLKQALIQNLSALKTRSQEELLQERYTKLTRFDEPA